jgi:D-glycerate 3-kinase
MDGLAEFMARERLPSSFLLTVEQLYAPLAQAIVERRAGRPGFLVGLAGPQGSGKSTGAAVLRLLLEEAGLRVASFSLDDLYLTRRERLDLASTVHPLLRTRGPPGTHDLEMGVELVSRLVAADSVALPSFDKGADDRRPRSEWGRFEGSADVVLFEGWCVGARPQDEAELAEPVNALEREQDPDGVWRRYVNWSLEAYQAMFTPIDMLIQLRAPNFEWVLRWRREQEAKLRPLTVATSERRVMTDLEVANFIQHYERVSRHIDREMPIRADVVIELGEQREIVRMEFVRNVGT